MKKLRLGVVGCGNMSNNHKNSYSNVEVTAVADINEEKAKSMAEYLDIKHWAKDYHDIFEYVDALLLVLPHHLHYEIGMECLKAGKHVLMEKPLCNTEEECLSLTRYAKEHDLVLMVAYCVRYYPYIGKIKEFIQKKTYGEVFQISIWTEQFTYRPDTEWIHNKEKLGGGQLFSHGCHYIDVLLHLLGEPVMGTHLGSNRCVEWMEREGTSHVSMKFENGTIGYHGGTWGARGSKLKYSFHMHTDQGMIEVCIDDDELKGERRNVMYFHQNGKDPVILDEWPVGKMTSNEITHFADCVLNGKTPITDASQAMQSLRVIWRLYEAEDKGVVADLRGLGLDDEWDIDGLGRLPE